MIIEGICNLLFALVGGLLSFLPEVTWSVDAAVFTNFLEILRLVGYLLPMRTVMVIFSLVISFGIFRIGVALIKTLLKFIPFF